MTALSYGFTKLVVADLERAVAFYHDVFGMESLHRVVAEDHAYALDEVIMALSGAPDSHKLVITRYLQRPCPPSGAVWTGFAVPDIDAALDAVIHAGGAIEVPVHENPEHGVRAAIASDPEGHLIEIIQMLTR